MRQVPFNKHNFTDYIVLTNSTGVPVTGQVAANLTASYNVELGARVAITLSDLAAVTSVFSSGGFKEVDSVNCPGLYRIDCPDAMWAYATGVDKVYLSFKGVSINPATKEYYLVPPSVTQGSTTQTGTGPWTFSDGTIKTNS